MKKLISFFTAFAVMITSFACFPLFAEAVSVPSAALKDYWTYPIYENIFTLEDDLNTEYVLLDTLSDGFLIMTNKVYEARPFDADGTQKFDPNDENNIAHYLNNEFLNEIMPESMRAYIAERSWKTEGGNAGGICPDTYLANCRISLLSFEEYNEYYKKFGTVDHDNQVDWWLRTGDGSKKGNVISGGGVYTNWGKFVSTDATVSAGVRPIFVLTKEFFENVRINSVKIGKNVKSEIVKNVKADEILKAGYSAEKLRRIGYESVKGADEYVDITIPNEPYYMQDHKYSYFEVDISHTDTDSRDYTIEYTLGEAERKIDVTVSPYKAYSEKISLKDEKKGVYNLDIKVMRNGEVVGYDSARVCLIDYYKHTPLDKYSRIGLGMPSWHKEEKASTARTTIQSFVDLVPRVAEAGFTKVRYSPEWTWIEKERGVYRFDKDRYDYTKAVGENELTVAPFKVGFGNQVVTKRETSNKMAAPNTRDGIEGYADYAVGAKKLYDSVMKPGGTVNEFELWNEPSLKNYWYPEVNFLEYTQMANAAAYKIKSEYPDNIVMLGCMTPDKMDENYDIMLRNGALMYGDEISIHPYTYPYDPDQRHIVRVPDYLKKIEEYGGWFDIAVTEVGWPTWESYNTTTQEQQLVYMVKMLVYNDEMGFALTNIFSARDQGLQKTYVEHGFGLFEYNDRPKPSVASLSFYNNNANDSLYVGEFEITEGAKSFLYKKAGVKNPFAICWVTDAEKEKEYTLKDNQYATDIFGNKLDEKTITIGKTPVYIFNLPDSVYMKAISHDISGIYTELTEKLGDKFDFSPLNDLANEATQSKGNYSDTKKYLDKYFDLAQSFTDSALQSENLTDKNAALIAFIMFKKGESMAASLENMRLGTSQGITHYQKSQNAAADKKGDEPESSLLFTDAMLRYAKRYTNRISEIKDMGSFNGDRERMGYYAYLSDKVCNLADIMQKYETPNSSRAIFTYSTQTRQTMYKGKTYTIKAEFENLRNKDFDGTAILVDENGTPIGEEVSVKAKSGGYTDLEVSGIAPKNHDMGTYIYKIQYKEDGEVVKEQEIEVILKSLVDIDLKAAENTLSNLDSITVEVKNTFDSAVNGKIRLTAPDGWDMETEKEINIPSGETQNVEFKINSYNKVPFNEYCFNISVIDADGSELARKEKLLDFRIMTYDEKNYNPEEFDGDITGWEDAYPIYVEAPENPSDINSWLGLNRSLKVLMKWNKDNIYVMTDVYDAVQNNTFTSFDLWQGDSVQVAIDTLMNGLAEGKTSGYQDDDYEFGFGLTPKGLETYLYQASDAKTGVVEGEQLVNVIRNDKLGLTRYLIKIPSSYVKQLKLENGNKFGFNIAANDADILLRDGYSQYTSGICDKKNPSMFKSFTLVTGDSAATETSDRISFYQKVETIRQGN
ncbi:MAG: DUF6273 domain-containing protein [Oscillospiraceae bacterium]|nr:DUF6273 domain-containing protein [Oscillospiraceae bacterium]